MIKKTIKFDDFDGVPSSVDVYFNLSKAELMELEVDYAGGLGETIKKIQETEDNKGLVALLKRIILMSYGVRQDNRFVKSEQLSLEFSQTAAYPELFMELATDAEAANEFIGGVMPQGLNEQLEAAAAKAGVAIPTQTVQPQLPPPPTAPVNTVVDL